MAEKDIAPGLLARIRKDFLELAGEPPAADTYTAAAEYAERVGAALAEALRRNLTADALPDGRLYWNLADRVVRPLLEDAYARITDIAAAVQQTLNQQAGFGLAPQRTVPDPDRVDGLLNKLSQAEHFEDVQWVLDEPVCTFSRMAVDDTLKANVEFQGKAGLRPRVVRIAESGCCKWCASLAGSYDYPQVPRDVYRRHERCRCRVEYDPGEGRRQNVWDKHWVDDEDIQKRKAFADAPTERKTHIPQESPAQNVLPEYLRTAAPGSGSISYESEYDLVKYADEVSMAQWIHDNLGGDILLLKESLKENEKRPDYLWRGTLWDLKTASSEKSANSSIRHGLQQIRTNPGGIILNFGKTPFDPTMLWSVIDKRMQWNRMEQPIDILVVSHNQLVSAKRYNKK